MKLSAAIRAGLARGACAEHHSWLFAAEGCQTQACLLGLAILGAAPDLATGQTQISETLRTEQDRYMAGPIGTDYDPRTLLQDLVLPALPDETHESLHDAERLFDGDWRDGAGSVRPRTQSIKAVLEQLEAVGR